MPGGSSSPLSSPPESVIEVATGSPAADTQGAPDLGGLQEANAEATASDIGRDRDGSRQSSAEKRKRTISLSGPAKKLRRPLAAIRKSAKEKKWEAPFVYTNEKSPLARADLRAILLLPGAWDVLTQEEKQSVLAKFPDETHILDAGTPNARPNTASLRNDDNFRHDCAAYCENIKLGRHDEEWLRQAWTAHEKHKRGDHDAFLRMKFETDWNVELPQDNEPGHGESVHSPEGDPTNSKPGVSESPVPEPNGAQPSNLPSQGTNNLPNGSEAQQVGNHAIATQSP
ncbi:uncharacterized protein THITE_2107538 [Thermothielavioides terrestris NRRL 8126]|uniref:ASX DEUBAD domain-containing protein n=1 Tax=Thermothielavioides terrestris (strain ATCC 38088 / NRRL 8126) TaxID=578455 RepID=G2QU86_THETT|nr:uncharacterized protein THITE_2107538 [Thermothielavioides terrestris NRRL 8126]AEO62838.1 hypothetical protein THITE_2107538 [Thermothielavioides terrestris NRRL 8126]